MKLFRKKNRVSKELHPFIVRVLVRINNKLKLWAEWLQQKTNKYSNNKRKMILLIFCLIFVSESLFVVYQSIKVNTRISYRVTPIRTSPLLEKERVQPTISEIELNRIHRFKIFLDSLQTTSEGKLSHDSFLYARPHI